MNGIKEIRVSELAAENPRLRDVLDESQTHPDFETFEDVDENYSKQRPTSLSSFSG